MTSSFGYPKRKSPDVTVQWTVLSEQALRASVGISIAADKLHFVFFFPFSGEQQNG